MLDCPSAQALLLLVDMLEEDLLSRIQRLCHTSGRRLCDWRRLIHLQHIHHYSSLGQEHRLAIHGTAFVLRFILRVHRALSRLEGFGEDEQLTEATVVLELGILCQKQRVYIQTAGCILGSL